GGTDVQNISVTVTDVDEFDVGAVTDSNAAANTVTEDTIVGSTVWITALATDPDGTDTVTYSLSDDAGGLFTIDTNTGVITVANALDYETATSHSVTVLATSSDSSTSSQAFTINVTDINEDVVGPVTDSNVAANSVAEDAINGTVVGITALATDPDGTDTVTYSLSDDAGGLFTIDTNTGVITVANALDYETATSHSVTVLATSSDTSTSSQAFTINV
ncbi:MAG: cadherin repeat domain-containing protein, partial [Desulfobacterales bacterium]|nr:cadherin repeat domain-containing protein [Desulfobacterales bacterium]